MPGRDRMGFLERLFFLRTVRPLEGLALTDAAAIAGTVKEIALGAGTEIPPEPFGEPGVWFVCEGTLLRYEAAGPGQDEPAPAPLTPGSSSGLLHVLARRPGPRLRAEEPVRALWLGQDDIEDLFEQHFEIFQALIGWVCRLSLDRISALPPGRVLANESHTSADPSALPRGPTGFTRRLGWLAAAELFPAGHMDPLSELAQQCEEVRIAAGEVLWRPGDPASEVLLVKRGSVRCVADPVWHSHGDRGVTVGEYEALAGLPRRFEARTETEVHALRLRADLLFDVLEDHAAMALDLSAALAARCLEFVIDDPAP